MFKSKTVFIVGAGASREADLPDGSGLKGNIAGLLDIRFQHGYRQISGDDQIVDALQRHVRQATNQQGDLNSYLGKARHIRDILPTLAISIDNYLDAHQGDEETELCGKLSIVRAILNAEKASKLRAAETYSPRYNLGQLSGTWYSKFFQMLTENVQKANVENIFENVSIITFNYDRCIERFLPQAIADYYHLGLSDAEGIVDRNLRIYHPYGQVGPLPWQDPVQGVPFGSQSSDLLFLARGIKTFAEGRLDETLVQMIHNEIIDAETVVYLGFAFHPLNMRLLTPSDGASPRRIFATTLGMSNADEQVIADDIWRMLGRRELSMSERTNPELAQLTCADFFQQYFRSMSASADNELPLLVDLPHF